MKAVNIIKNTHKVLKSSIHNGGREKKSEIRVFIKKEANTVKSIYNGRGILMKIIKMP